MDWFFTIALILVILAGCTALIMSDKRRQQAMLSELRAQTLPQETLDHIDHLIFTLDELVEDASEKSRHWSHANAERNTDKAKFLAFTKSLKTLRKTQDRQCDEFDRIEKRIDAIERQLLVPDLTAMKTRA